MKSDEEIKTDVYRHIMGSQLQQAVTGTVKKTRRPHNSTKEDIVISVLANEVAQIQVATVNVNIFVSDIIIENQPEEDTIRCRDLCLLASNLFEVFHGDGFRATLLSQRVFENTGEHPEHVINHKIEYKYLNE